MQTPTAPERISYSLPAFRTFGSRSTHVLRSAALLLCLIGLGRAVPLHAQEPDSLEQTQQKQTYRVETTDGEVLLGTLVSATDTAVVLRSDKLGTVTLQRTDIQGMDKLDPDRFHNGRYWFKNPQSTRYFFAPNALGVPKGEGYYQNTWILFNNVNYGVSDHFSVGAGTVPLFLFGANIFPIWALPKLSLSTPQKNLHLAGGAVLGGVLGAGESVGVGVVYGSVTVGNRNHNATLSLGYGYAEGELADTPAINVSGMTRISQDFYLITENYFFPAVDASLISAGIRWAPENFAVDFGLARPLLEGDGGFIGVPWLGVTISFGR
jgi:hypothetical protein